MVNATQSLFPEVDEERRNAAESQIVDKQKITDYDIREYPVEIIVGKFTTGLEQDEAEIYIPDYQRELVWTPKQQSRFIESILLNLPVPYIFVADTREGERAGRLEIVDGSQRIRTLVRFLRNELKLVELELLSALNGFKFEDLLPSRQLRFKRKTLRMIELTDQADEEARREMFDRLNSGGTKLKSMEQRMGSRDGPFLQLVKELAGNPKLLTLCPISKARKDRREYEELVLRFFAYLDRYSEFDKSVDDFLNDYLDEMNDSQFDSAVLAAQFRKMLDFIEANFHHGFRKNKNNSSVPRIRFEALSIGAALALAEQPDLNPQGITSWLESQEFSVHTKSDASNSKPKVINRIHFVRDHLLGRQVEYVQDSDA